MVILCRQLRVEFDGMHGMSRVISFVQKSQVRGEHRHDGLKKSDVVRPSQLPNMNDVIGT